MGRYFGTDGFRGEANISLTADQAYRIGRFLGWYYTRLKTSRARILIGKDTRRSSYMFEYALAAGLTASGADGWLLHVTTTPSVAYVARTEGFDAGIMISASHNPYQDNGIKLINGSGEKMEESVVCLVEDYLDGKLTAFGRCWEELPLAKGAEIGRTVDHVAGRNRYMGYLISLGQYSFKGIRVGLDCANGSAWNLARSVFDALGAKTYLIHAEPDGCNINRDCGSTHLDDLKKFVTDHRLDVGFAYDGDADRCLCVDELGNEISGDHILYLCACWMKREGTLSDNQVVTTVMSNLGLYQALEEQGIHWAATAVGDKHVYEYMMRHGCSLGGEQSGHIIFSKYATTGDGILTSLKVMEVMLAKKQPLSKLCEGLSLYPQLTANIQVADKKRILQNPQVQNALAETERKLEKCGRVLVRESGTEPVIRVMVEAKDRQMCEDCMAELVRRIESCEAV